MRSVLTYVILVGIPLAGLIGILRIGEGLVAPRPVAGEWVAIERGSRAAWEPGCRTTSDDTEETEQTTSTVRIEQSGARAEMKWSGLRTEQFRATLRGDTLEGKLALKADRGCPGGTLTLRALVGPISGRDHIIGELLPTEECPGCRRVPVDWRRRR